MNREQGAKITKDKLLLLVFLKFKLVVDPIPKLMAYVAAFKLRVEAADSFKDDQLINIKGYAEKKQNAKKIVQQWYFDGQPEPSIVTIKLHADKESTSVELRHTNIPDLEYEGCVEGWDNS